MKGIIYKISSSAGLPYIGSTTQQLSRRMSKHRQKRKCMSRIHINQPDLEITILEEGEYDSDLDLRKRETVWMKSISCCNKQLSYNEERQQKREGYDKQYEKTRLLRKLPFFNASF